jgi:hypothetical protein
LRVCLEVEAAKVGVISTRDEVDGGGFIENSGESVGDRHDEGGGRGKTGEMKRPPRGRGCP